MKVTFSVKTRKDGSIGIPKDKQRLMGLHGHTAVRCNWDSAAGTMTVVPVEVGCQCCGKSIRPDEGKYDATLQTCMECTRAIEDEVRNGLSLWESVALRKRQCNPVGHRSRK